MPINFSTMAQWLLQFENEDITRNHTIVSSDNYIKICQKLYAGAHFSKKVEAFMIEPAEHALANSMPVSIISEKSPLLLPFNFYNGSYCYAKFQLEHYMAELHNVPPMEVGKIVNTLSVIQIPDCYTLQMIDIELRNDICDWHHLREGGFESRIVLEPHAKRSLQLTFILIQLWMRKLSKMSDQSTTLIFLSDSSLLSELLNSDAWKYTYRRLASFNMYLVTPAFRHEQFGLTTPPIILSDTGMSTCGVGFGSD